MPPRKDEEAESRKRGSADVELDGGGARRKGARTEAAAAAATSAKTEENGGARAGRTKGLRVKLAGAGKCTRRGAEEESVAEDPGAEESVANPAADAPAAETVSGGSGGGGGAAEVPTAKFQVGAVIILYNGSLRYEAEVLKVSLSEPKKSAPTAKGGRGRVASPGPSISYLVRYTKWPRRPEEWVGEAFAYQWDESLAKIVTNRPPRKQMWVESKADKAKSAEADGGEASAAGDATGEEAKGKSGRASAKGDAAAEAGEQAPGGRGQRGRKPTEKGVERAASDAAAEMASMGTEPDEDEGGLAMLMKLGRKATPKRDEEDEEGEEGDEEEEGGEEEEGEEEDDEEEGSDESDNEQAEQANSNDDMSAGEDEDEDMIRIARERAAANPQSMLLQMAEMTADVPKPKAEATHRRKGVPLKSIQRKAHNGQAGYQEHAKVHSKQMSIWQQQVREQTRMVDASSIVLSAEDGNSANSARGGAQRRRKQLYPAPSLLPLF